MYRLPKCLGDAEKANLPLQNLLKGSARRRSKDATAVTTDVLVATDTLAQTLIWTKQSEHISNALNFPALLYTIFLQIQSYIDDSSALVE